MRFLCFLLAALLGTFPLMTQAIEAPVGQVHLDTTKVLRGRFVEQHQVSAAYAPMQSSGSFVVAPAYGLIWGIEKPFPTATVITPQGATQSMGGLALKLPIRNLRYLYDIVGGALAGDWNGFEKDFTLTRSGNGAHWQMLLTSRNDTAGKKKLPYATITVSGSRFVENIVMTKADGSSDSLDFMDEALSPTPLTSMETALFNQADQTAP